MIKRALISVSDKTGIIDFAKKLDEKGIEIISTGGTAKALSDEGIKVISISDVTGFPECLDGRVKTLHPNIFAGLLAMREKRDHMETLEKLHINTIDMVVVNLYPFKKTIEKDGVLLEEAIENIDIGGPSMLRAAAKNYKHVAVITDPSDYDMVLDEIMKTGQVTDKTRFKLAAKVFNHTAHYDALIASYLWEKAEMEKYPQLLTLTYEKAQDLRYGENPHQSAAYYKDALKTTGRLHNAEQLNGKELSYNNINDANAALELLKEFNEPACIAVKHANPCGAGVGKNIFEAYEKAYEGDPISIFGGIVAVNEEIDEKTAEELAKIFLEIVIAPSYSDRALEILREKKNLRVLKLEDIRIRPEEAYELKRVSGGLLIQDSDYKDFSAEDISYVTEKKPTEQEMKDLLFAWKVVKHVKSNAIVIAKDGRTLGVGPGQTNRIWSAEMSIDRAGEQVKGAVMASDAFFPFPDVAAAAANAGIRAIIQPGGSLKDKDSVEVCNKEGIAMIFTGMRHFKH
ncbi:bifunctional phosphoribosylaminoimidazolecarboxamide formyltransferase/IMP cyclohydrolase [Lutispora sp.]|uniref:bifunctional phosphoribosylaminoimidazolecarboxamide formyltransferase/IMP cyclohydrolase n=1 Tax=Lutispora sp. TaxID=2828727 RepID=UPI002B1FACF9|nr:bifunctional phosphoribosylaminoimidazolecarboxamide formyltransferase/IMP cyclohydrolase [Lutispora sp.]MEA4961964.1 bifunctional phosphoribosylaminoimidazolecarboxamide formyltransferase/IMP cyclohydrolase [Lutispora sp.]